MGLSLIADGESTAVVSGKLNAAITGLNNASGPNVIHVTTTGNDTTGEGTLAKPYLTLGRAVTEADGDPCTFRVGRGTFPVTVAGWSENQVIIGEGWGATIVEITSSAAVSVIAHDCDVSIDTNGAVGAVGSAGDSITPIGGDGASGGNASEITVKGTARGVSITAKGGVGGAGGAGYNDGEGGQSLGGVGGLGGNSAVINIQVPIVIAIVDNGAVDGGAGGLGANGGSDGLAGSAGMSAALYLDSCDIRSATVTSGTNTVSRCYVPASYTIANDHGGNALAS
jgi:hypothetical protein